jgi:hypothetical protein
MRTYPLSLHRFPGHALFGPAVGMPSFLPSAGAALARTDADRAQRAAELPERQRGWLARLDDWCRAQQRRDVEAYLAQSTDVYDLEVRMRTLDRSAFHPYY